MRWVVFGLMFVVVVVVLRLAVVGLVIGLMSVVFGCGWFGDWCSCVAFGCGWFGVWCSCVVFGCGWFGVWYIYIYFLCSRRYVLGIVDWSKSDDLSLVNSQSHFVFSDFFAPNFNT